MGKDSLDIVVTTREVFVIGPILPTKPVSNESYSNNLTGSAGFDRRGSFPGNNERTPGKAEQERLWNLERAVVGGEDVEGEAIEGQQPIIEESARGTYRMRAGRTPASVMYTIQHVPT